MTELLLTAMEQRGACDRRAIGWSLLADKAADAPWEHRRPYSLVPRELRKQAARAGKDRLGFSVVDYLEGLPGGSLNVIGFLAAEV